MRIILWLLEWFNIFIFVRMLSFLVIFVSFAVFRLNINFFFALFLWLMMLLANIVITSIISMKIEDIFHKK